jgi:biotin synthase
MTISELLNKEELSHSDLVQLLKIERQEDMELLYRKADEIKQKYCGNKIHLRGIIEFSNYCRQDCYYCGIRNENKNVNRYRMSIEEILHSTSLIYNAGIRTIVLQSGEDLAYDKDKISRIIKSIKEKFDMAITLSLGQRTFEEYRQWKEAGADRYLLKHETANPSIYFDIHPYQNFEDRINHIKYLKSIDFQVGSGNIIGLPNQTLNDIADDIILCKVLNVDMASFSPFISADDTPYKNVSNCGIDIVLKTMAVARIYLKDVHIPATTALSTLNPDGRKKGLLAGANVIMPTYTPNNFRFNYLIYKNKPGGSESPNVKLSNLNELANELKLSFSSSKGHSLKI